MKSPEARAFEGLKITQDAAAAHTFGLAQVRLSKRDEILVDEAGLIGWGGNSGFQALNLAVQFGAKRVVLVGFDMTLARGVHWHGPHGRGLHNPTRQSLSRWAGVFDDQVDLLADLGVEVLNVSPDSAIQAFPKVSLQEALGC